MTRVLEIVVLATALAGCRPNAPTDVTAKPAEASATVHWTAPRHGRVDGYRITTHPGDTVVSAPADATTTAISGLVDGTSYTFDVAAVNWRGLGPVATSSPVTPSGPPGSPMDPTAELGDSAVVVSWTAPLKNGGTPITGYTVTETPGGKTFSVTRGLSLKIVGLERGTPYTFTVHATNAAGIGPESDSTAPVTPVLVCDVPGGSAVAAVRRLAERSSCLFQIAAERTGGQPESCSIKGSRDGEWGRDNIVAAYRFAQGWRLSAEFAQFDAQGATPNRISEELQFGTPVNDLQLATLIRTCQCELQAVARDAAGRPEHYVCEEETNEGTHWRFMVAPTRNAAHEITSISVVVRT